jgi:metallo-beta-lactamase family protein
VSPPRLHFFGAASTVTGSCYLVEHGGRRVLVDCGLFQGSKTLKELNYQPFPFDPEALDAVLLTHAHIDHSGLVPKLVRAGYRGRIHATAGTRDLLTYMLPDSGAIQEGEVERLNRRRSHRGETAVEPIYTRADAEAALAQIDAVELGETMQLGPNLRARFLPAGHILGAASIEIELGAEPLRLLLSGDLGPHAPPPERKEAIDYLVVESTYGGRDGERPTTAERRARLGAEVRTALDRGGNLLIPAFAVERTQALLYDLAALFADDAIPPAHVFLDSPLAIRATEVFARHYEPSEERPDLLRQKNFHFVETADHSKRLNAVASGAIILAGSGMCEAGRIRHHLRNHLWRGNATVLFVGYQAPGTLGRLIQSGLRAVRIMGEEVQVAARIRTLEIYSAHADESELVDWVAARQPVRHAIVLTHGEEKAIEALRHALDARLEAPPPILAPALGNVLALDRAEVPALKRGRLRLPTAKLGEADWHNRYAAFLLRLAERLRGAGSEKERETLVRRVERALARSPG